MQGQKGNDYSDFMIIFLVALLILFTMFSKYLFFYYLFAWKAVTIPVVFLIKSMPDFLAELIFFWAPAGVSETADKIFQVIISKNNSYFVDKIDSYKLINKHIGLWLKPYIVIFLVYGIYVILNKRNFNRVYLKKDNSNVSSVDMLLEQEAKIWPSIKIMINEHPELEANLDSGKWAMSKRTEQFVKDFNLIDHFTDENDEQYFSLNEERTFKVLNKQMGKPWSGVDHLTKVERQMFAVIAPKILRNTDETKNLISALATYYSSEKKTIFNYWSFFMHKRKTDKLIEQTVKKYSGKEEIKKITDKHFFKKTVFAALLETARTDGVLANSEFLWLKIKDRELWYMLNNVGRKSCFAECCAPWAHLLAEKSLDRKIANPMIANAIIAIDQDLFDTHYEYKRIFEPESDVVE